MANQKWENIPLVIDTRPWLMRKTFGEIKIAKGFSFTDILEKDPMGSGALVMKHPVELHEMFEEIEGLSIRSGSNRTKTQLESKE
mmetsp:Transcript_3149/g.5264  ORF Transcript_3149/g.5264 Transcript_3149/m.5264 type:complete len:85 (+) Transcript_3149:108-362(+)